MICTKTCDGVDGESAANGIFLFFFEKCDIYIFDEEIRKLYAKAATILAMSTKKPSAISAP